MRGGALFCSFLAGLRWLGVCRVVCFGGLRGLGILALLVVRRRRRACGLLRCDALYVDLFLLRCFLCLCGCVRVCIRLRGLGCRRGFLETVCCLFCFCCGLLVGGGSGLNIFLVL